MNLVVMDCLYVEVICFGICFIFFVVIWCLKFFVFWKMKNLSFEFICIVLDYLNVCVLILWNFVFDNIDFFLIVKVIKFSVSFK